jgi:maltooligosyltrehalose trehalohydrolase
MQAGAFVDDGGTTFAVWAPRPREIALEVEGRRFALSPRGDGWWEARADGVRAGARYAYLVDGRRRPDPASLSQPDGVHAPSEVIDLRAFSWKQARRPRDLEELVIYELHVGTFTAEGTFDGAARQLGRLVELGVTAVELMPVGAFPGARNWGYDGVYWRAVQVSYGGPAGLSRFVDAAHARGLTVILDVVYNHFGPEGNYLAEYAPYFTERHHTPWGAAIDYSVPAVRAHVIDSARLFVERYRIDGLRLDAVQAIADDSPTHIVAELTAAVRPAIVIAESDLADTKVLEVWRCDAQWSDDLHHALHAAISGERSSYYADFGRASQLARAVSDGFVLTGELSRMRGRAYGMPSKHLPGVRFVVCSQNHDQIGNRAAGERLAQLVPGSAHAAAAAVLLSPAVPLLFMGEEHADPAPFLYFTDHGDPGLRQAVTEGRRREYGHVGEVPDPQDPQTFARSRVSHGSEAVRRWYRTLLALRRERPSLRALDKTRTDARGDDERNLVTIRRWSDRDETLALISLARKTAGVEAPAPRHGRWRLLFDATDFDGPRGARMVERDRALHVELPPFGVVILGTG